ncbi:hypothetical protein VNO80_07020 [Phaseolus coccineus]|uniref:Uncharacterized protein n=1 Tax=Phaseolus coccineus TaxID=3886 RepID=A0AAN9NHX6_PHACN
MVFTDGMIGSHGLVSKLMERYSAHWLLPWFDCRPRSFYIFDNYARVGKKRGYAWHAFRCDVAPEEIGFWG